MQCKCIKRRCWNVYGKEAGGRYCSRRIPDNDGLSVRRRTLVASPREKLLLSDLLTPKPEAPCRLIAAEKQFYSDLLEVPGEAGLQLLWVCVHLP